MTARVVRDKVNVAGVVGVKLDSRGVYAFARPQGQQRMAECVPADARQIGAAGAGAGGGDDGVAGVASFLNTLSGAPEP